MNFPDISPIAFNFFGFPIRWYALAYLVGFVFAFYLVLRLLAGSLDNRIGKRGLDNLLSYSIFGVIIGGRLGYVLFYNLPYFLTNPVDILKVYEGGMSFHGGCLGVIAAISLWCEKNKEPLFPILDFAAISVTVGLFLGRIANFVNAELYGRPTSSPIGIVFPDAGPLPRHPSQLYEAVGEGLVLFIILSALYRIKAVRRRPGIIGFSFILGYGIARFIVEFFREPDAHIGYIAGWMTLGQILTIPLIVVGVVGIYIMARRKPVAGCFVTAINIDAPHSFMTKNNHLPKDCLQMLQEHTTNIVLADQNTKPRVADAIITTTPGLKICVRTADCAPILIHDPIARIVAAIHSGWRGFDSGIIEKTIVKLVETGASLKNLRVAIGPSIGPDSYEVDEAFRNRLATNDILNARFFRPKPGIENKFLFDLPGAIRARFRRAGIRNIAVAPFDTCRDSDLFHSHRRGAENDRRQYSIIGLDP